MYRKLKTVTIIALSLLPMMSMAYYHPDGSDKKDQPIPSQLIVKINPDFKTILSANKSSIAQTGVQSFDAVNKKYKIVDQRKLYDKSPARNEHPLLKNTFIIEVPDGADVEQLIIEYKNSGVVEYAHPDYQMELYAEPPDDTLYYCQWGMNNEGQVYLHVHRNDGCNNDYLSVDSGFVDADIDWREVYENPPDNTVATVVAIIDTGVDMDHPDLIGRIWTNPREIADNGIDDDNNGYIDDLHGWDYSGDGTSFPLQEDNDPTDEYGHGTHCAGIVAATTNNDEGIAGVSPDSKIMCLKFYPIMKSSYAAQAIIYAADNGADVISMSWGYPYQVDVVEEALAYARLKGVVPVAAAGNDGTEAYNYPASYSGIITVGATQSRDSVTVFSTYGSHINVSAPGLSIMSLRADTTDMYEMNCEPGVHVIDSIYMLASGTSMACPHVAGAAAYLRSVSPGLTPDEIENILETTADDIETPGWDEKAGYGRINLYNALQQAPGRRALITSPQINQILFGTIDIIGIADGTEFSEYTLEYGLGDNPTDWIEIISSTTPVTDGLLGSLNSGTLEGKFTIRLRVGETNEYMISVYIANTVAAEIESPAADDSVINWATIVGSASCPEFNYYTLEYGAGLTPTSYNTILGSSIPISGDILGEWFTGTLTDGWYNLRLMVYSQSGFEAADSIPLYIHPYFHTPPDSQGWKIDLNGEASTVPNYGDFDNDGQNEIVIGTSEGLKFFNPDGTEKTEGLPSFPDYDFRIPVSVGDLNGDNLDDFVAVGVNYSSATLYGYLSGGTTFGMSVPSPDLVVFENGIENLSPFVSLKDIDNDQCDEIHYGTGSGNDYYLYDSDGSFLTKIPTAPNYGNYAYLSADIDGDGYDEFYAGNSVLYMFDQSGTLQDSLYLAISPLSYYRAFSLLAVDIDGDSRLELIAFGVGESESVSTYWTFAFDENLQVKENWPQNSRIDSFDAPAAPVFADINLDGKMEYLITRYGITYGGVIVWSVDGIPYAGDSTYPVLAAPNNPCMLHIPVIGDVTGDGYPDIVTPAEPDVWESYGLERIIAWDHNGTQISGWPIITEPSADAYNTQPLHTPVLGDISNDGYTDIMMTTVSSKLIFVNFEGSNYSPNLTPAPFWRINRQMNAVGEVYNYCGDVDNNGTINIFDVTYLITYLYLAGPPPNNLNAADINSDGGVNIFDITGLISYLYLNGPEPNCP